MEQNNNLLNLTKLELLTKCKELGITKCSSKNKSELIDLIKNKTTNPINNINEINNENQYKFIDLFCGIGGFHQANKRLNGKCVFACDIDKNCRYIYEKNYGLKPEGDITKIDINNIPSFDILCGGFPCQSFSNSGNKKGLDDKRGQLFEYILKIAVAKKPSFMFLENVKHIKKIEDGVIFNHILKRINESGYFVDENNTFELSPHQFGIPQQRERVIFVCIRQDLYDNTKQLKIVPPNTPINVNNILEKDKKITDKYKISSEDEAILEIWDKMINEFDVGESLSPTILCNEFYKKYTDKELKSLPAWKQDYIKKNKPLYNKYKEKWDKWYDTNKNIIMKKEIYGKLEWQVGKKKVNDSIFNHFIQFRQSGIRVKKNEYFPTLVAIVQTPIYAKERRYITPRECARLQSFPDDLIIHENDHTAYKQFGNAVNVDVIHFVIYNTLKLYNFNYINNT
jgi:DNA (cytosine-5)-methyltransferase 1